MLGRTEVTTYWRARHLGLQCGCPRGFETLSAAAERAGYTTGQLREILRAGGHKVRRTLSRPGASRTGRRYHYVDPLDVDDAVAAWVKRESVERIAERQGLTGDVVRKLLVEAGHAPPARKKCWRVESAVADRLIAEHRAMMPVAVHARRLGIWRTTLAKRLRAAGVLGPKRAGVNVRLPVDVVDRAIGRAA